MLVRLQELIDALQEKAKQLDDPHTAQVGLIGYNTGSRFQGVTEVDVVTLYDSGQKTEIVWLVLEPFELGK